MSNKVTLNTDNPARRLLHILQEGKDKPHDSPCEEVWFELLEVEDEYENRAVLRSRLGKVMALPEKIVNQMQYHYPNQNSTLKYWIEKINTAFFTQNLDAGWGEFNDHIDKHVINYLSMSADLLDGKGNTQILEADKLLEIRETINDLLTGILEEDIDEHFKAYIVHYLRKIIVAVEEYKISGATPIVESIAQTLGHSTLDEKYKEGLFKTETGKKITTVLAAAASIVTICVGLPQLPEHFQFLLSGEAE